MNKGFTLIELLVVVLIVGILSAVALPQYTTAVERSRATEGITLMSDVAKSAERYRSQKEVWPTSFDVLDVEIPENGTSSHGGKLFDIAFGSCSASGTTCAITATRKNISNAYKLTTTITELDSGAFSTVRKCEPVSGSDTKATDFCNAITGGKNTDF